MSDRSAIEWTDATWNPIRARFLPDRWQCRMISPGCDNCYASTMNRRLGGSIYRAEGSDADDLDVRLRNHLLLLPLQWKKPRRVFVCSMTDLFGQWVPDFWIEMIFDVMAQARQHQFQVLTKRPARMAQLVSEKFGALENVWLGTSIELDQFAWRANYLRKTPAAVRFVSAEPLLGPLPSLDLAGIDWLITGGESGARHRPCEPEWVRDLRDRSLSAGTAFFHKQWGGRTHAQGGRELDGRTWDEYPRMLAEGVS